jgi:hypothetical protein
VDPVHQEIPDAPPSDAPVFLAPDISGAAGASGSQSPATNGTQADKIVDQYRQIGAAQNHVYGEGAAPNFNIKVPGVNAPALPYGASGVRGATGLTGSLAARGYTGTQARGYSGGAARPATGGVTPR